MRVAQSPNGWCALLFWQEDLDSEAIRDKYADEPPPDHIRYTGGVRPMPKAQTQGDEQANATADTTAALIAADAAVEDIEEEVDAAKEIQRQVTPSHDKNTMPAAALRAPGLPLSTRHLASASLRIMPSLQKQLGGAITLTPLHAVISLDGPSNTVPPLMAL
jgi:hypothetical protein